MRGKVIHFDTAQGFGFIEGDDGAHYAVASENLRSRAAPTAGDAVEFHPGGGRATDVFVLGSDAQAQTEPPKAVPQPAHFGRSTVPLKNPSAVTPAEGGLWRYFLGATTTRYADFSGRAVRKEYWGFALFFFVVLIGLSLAGTAIDLALGNLESGDEFPVASVALSALFVLASIIPAIAVGIRRQHDIGLSGWFYLVVLVPYVGLLVLVVFALIPSQLQDNRWGPVPAGVRAP